MEVARGLGPYYPVGGNGLELSTKTYLRIGNLTSNINLILYERVSLSEKINKARYAITIQRLRDTTNLSLIIIVVLGVLLVSVLHVGGKEIEPREWPSQNNPFEK